MNSPHVLFFIVLYHITQVLMSMNTAALLYSSWFILKSALGRRSRYARAEGKSLQTGPSYLESLCSIDVANAAVWKRTTCREGIRATPIAGSVRITRGFVTPVLL